MSASHAAILAGLLQAALVLGLYVLLGVRRVRWVAATKGAIREIALSSDAYPEDVRKVGNAVSNQFELPLLFYAGLGLDLYLGADWLFVALALLFVVSRLVHAFIHTTSNNVVQRFQAFSVGYFVVVAMWLWLFARLIMSAFGAA